MRIIKSELVCLTILFIQRSVVRSLSTPTPRSADTINARKFYVQPSNLLNIAASSTGMLTRLGTGAFVDGYTVKLEKETEENKESYAVLDGKVLQGFRVEESSTSVFDRRPEKLIELYEFEACPFCRKVREAVAILDLDVLFLPCPKGSTINRQIVKELGGKEQFPYMRDPNTGVNIYESDDIVRYLFDTYAPIGAKIPGTLTSGIVTTFTCGISLLPRFGKGVTKRETSKVPSQPLVYYGYEASPFCKVVREKLVELEIPHIQISCARGSSKRQAFLDKKGLFQVPYIEDFDTGVTMFESVDIIKYLEDTYAL